MVKELSELLIRGQTSTILIELEIGPELVEMLTGGWILGFDKRAINSGLNNKWPNDQIQELTRWAMVVEELIEYSNLSSLV